ncbi:MAG: hypothetical protein ACI841_002603 [Planctomycetota bacterium]|jgi:hypothetical protein
MHFTLRLASLAFSLALAPDAVAMQSGGPLDTPQLRIETGFHTAMINRIDASADGSTLISCSDDKTLRIWRRQASELVLEETIRTPIGADVEGKLYACAISPDGRHIAAAGWTGFSWSETGSIYLIDRHTGEMIRRISGIPNVVGDLSFDHQGERLLATLYAGAGARCYDLSGRELWRSESYQGHSTCGLWIPDGTCITSSYDGMLRKYSTTGELERSTLARGSGPSSLALGPRGELIVGHNASPPAVHRYSASSLKYGGEFIGAPEGAILSSVATVGQSIWTGGMLRTSNESPLFVWSALLTAARKAGPMASISDLRSVGKDALLVAGDDPSLSLMSIGGETLASRQSGSCDMRGKNNEHFRMNDAATKLYFGRGMNSESPIEFDLSDRRITTEWFMLGDMHEPRHAAPALVLEEWLHQRRVTINGNRVDLGPSDLARALVITPDDKSVLIGTEHNLMAVGPDGKESWSRHAPAQCWGLHASADSELIVAAYGDGTIRWHRRSDGEQLLSLFMHKDGKRWVMWTPSGYYDCSTGGEELIGWHVNRGQDQLADFFPAGRFREQFHRPSIVNSILETRDEAKAIARAGVQLSILQLLSFPPVVRVLSPNTGTRVSAGPLTLVYTARSDEELTEVQVLINGIEATRVRGLKVEPGETDSRSVTIDVPSDLAGTTGTVSIIAKNIGGSSEPAIVQVDIKASEQIDALTRPACYVLAIGVSDYEIDELDLGYAAKDARDICVAFQSQAGKLFRKVDTHLVEDATRQQVLEGLEWLEAQSTARDLAVVFFAGHGVTDNRDRYFFLSADSNPEKLRSSGVLYTEIIQTIEALPGKSVAFIDTCHAGNVTGGAKRRAAANAASMTRVINELASAENGSVVFAAATGNQFGLEKETWGNGAFTKAVVEALTGKVSEATNDAMLSAILARPTMTVNLLNAYVAERVKELTGGAQTPTMQRPATVPDFPIAIR